jgi:hypothetical protein
MRRLDRRGSIASLTPPSRLPSVRAARRSFWHDFTRVREGRTAVVLCCPALPPSPRCGARSRSADRLVLPPASIAAALLQPSSRRSFCEWKGVAAYWHLAIGDELLLDVGWSKAGIGSTTNVW